jgi:hypothetical protein
MTTKTNLAQAEAIAAALGAELAPLHDTTSETYLLTLKENRRARLSLQFGNKREPGRLFIEAIYPGDSSNAGRRISRHYRVVTEINEIGVGAEINASIRGDPGRIAVDIERHIVRNYLLVLNKVLPFFPEVAPVAVESLVMGSIGQLAT